jgi:Phage integrase, N-terminal SAM-like domain
LGYIEKQRGKYRARYPDPLGLVTSTAFAGKADAQRFLMEMEVDKSRGDWIDPRNADMPLAQGSEEFLALVRRLSPRTRQTYRRDLTRYVLPRLGAYRLGRIPPDEIENWLFHAS